jgi:ribosomal protein S1
VHISELAPHRVGQVTDVVQTGDVKTFRVLEVDEENRKIRLSLKPASEASAAAEAAAPADRSNKPGAAKRKKRRDSLKGGMEGSGVGLGNLSLDDLGG